MTTSKRRSLIIGIILFITALILCKTYRTYIYSNNIYDFHIADTLSSIFAVPAALFFLCGIYKKKIKIEKTILTITMTFILYEFLGSGTFDPFDIIATIISAIITYIILRSNNIKYL